MKRFGAVLLAALLLLGLSSCGTGETSTPAASSAQTGSSAEVSADTPALTAGCEEFSGVFSPFFAHTDSDWDAMELTQLRLLPNARSGQIVLHGIEGETIPYRGTDYTYYGPADLTITEQADGAVWYDVTLRDDLCFSDGTALTVDDLIFSLYVLCNPDYDEPRQLGELPIQGLDDYLGGAESISGIVRTGDYSLRLVLEQVDQRTLYALSEVCIAPLHYYGDAAAYDYEQNQFGFPKGDLSAIRAKNDAPLGAGAYQFVSYARGEITYNANARYYRGAPATEVYASNGACNRYGFADAELDALLQNADADSNPETRKALYQDCLTRIENWVVEVPLYQPQGAVVFHTEKIDAETFPTDLTACYSWLREAERVKLK